MATPARVLLIDDDLLFQVMVEDIVTQMGHQFHCAADGKSACAILNEQTFDLVLLDRRLPDTDGLLLAAPIKASAQCPFIILSSLSSPNDQVLGLGMGAEDYICKPVDPSVLRARMEKHLKTRTGSSPETHVTIGATITLNTLTRRLTVSGKTTTLSPAECRLMVHLARNLGTPLDRMHLSLAICGREWVYGDRTVDVLISRLRRHLRDSTLSIVTIHGTGYVLLDNSAQDQA